jgi:hypothetical protein
MIKNKLWDSIKNTYECIKNHDSISENVNSIWCFEGFDGKYDHTLEFYGTDSFQNYITSGNKNYSKTDVVYHVNEYGYRIPEKKDFEKETKPTIACFGCSQTRGVGLPWNETWTYFLEEKFDFKYSVKNYGVDGASADTIARLVSNYTINNKPKAILCLLPDIYRKELYQNNTIYGKYLVNFLRFTEEIEKNIQNSIVECKKLNFNIWDWKAYKQLSNEENSLYNVIKNIKFIEFLAESQNISLSIFTWDHYLMKILQKNKFNFSSVGKLTKEQYYYLVGNWFKVENARDNIHLGTKPNSIYADVFYRHIKDKIC